MRVSVSRMDIWQNLEKLQIQDGGRTPYWKSFLAISRRHIGQLMRNLDWRWRITCRYKLCDQNGNFLKFKTAHGCHFENSFIYISQPWIIRFRSYLVGRCELCIPRMDIWQKKSKFCKFKMADGRHIENGFSDIPRCHFGRVTKKFGEMMQNHMKTQVTWPKQKFSKIQDDGPSSFRN